MKKFALSILVKFCRWIVIPIFVSITFPNSAFAVHLTTLINFNGADGANPVAGLVSDPSGNLYGTTYGSGANLAGTVFRLTAPAAGQTAWTLTTLIAFNGADGSGPMGNLIRDAAGNLYGTTNIGGNGYGTVFRLAPPPAGHTAWTLTTLASFNYTNGAYPNAGLVRDSFGNLYGTTQEGGVHGDGTVFRLAPPTNGHIAWTLTTLATFNVTNGVGPFGELVRDPIGNLYGTTFQGGVYGVGNVFKLTSPTTGHTAWTLANIASFNHTNGAVPQAGLVRDSAGNLYGTTEYGNGTVFRLTPPTDGHTAWTLTTLANFNGSNGANPQERLLRDPNGNLYGTTPAGGANGYGTVFKLSPPTTGNTTWTLKTLISFNGTDGKYPYAGLVQDQSGNLYGTTYLGGAHGFGTVFKLTP